MITQQTHPEAPYLLQAGGATTDSGREPQSLSSAGNVLSDRCAANPYQVRKVPNSNEAGQSGRTEPTGESML
jgi:hypothetical protein